MTYADILILLKAGYTKDEIDAMDAPADEPQAEKVPASEPQAEPAAPAPEAPAEEPPADPTQQVLTQITELIKVVQANNRGNAEMGAEIIEPHQQALSTLRSLGGLPDNN